MNVRWRRLGFGRCRGQGRQLQGGRSTVGDSCEGPLGARGGEAAVHSNKRAAAAGPGKGVTQCQAPGPNTHTATPHFPYPTSSNHCAAASSSLHPHTHLTIPQRPHYCPRTLLPPHLPRAGLLQAPPSFPFPTLTPNVPDAQIYPTTLPVPTPSPHFPTHSCPHTYPIQGCRRCSRCPPTHASSFTLAAPCPTHTPYFYHTLPFPHTYPGQGCPECQAPLRGLRRQARRKCGTRRQGSAVRGRAAPGMRARPAPDHTTVRGERQVEVGAI